MFYNFSLEEMIINNKKKKSNSNRYHLLSIFYVPRTLLST